MNQADIEKLLLCRQVIQVYKTFNKLRALAIITSTDKPATTACIEVYRTEEALKLNSLLKDQGFINNDGEGSVATFSVWNDVCNFETYKECRPIQGTCDLCGLEELKDQPCFVKYGNAIFDCAAKPRSTDSYMDSIYKEVMRVEKEGAKMAVDGKILPVSYCLEGHGYHVIPEQCRDFPFDVFWRV